MASLSELLETQVTISDVMLRLLNQLKKNSDHLYAGPLNELELELLPGYYQRIIERNEKLNEM
jgi:octanoyl-[GcvH]:protein N-octanoyltransferase